jgi:hypothetical protein
METKDVKVLSFNICGFSRQLMPNEPDLGSCPACGAGGKRKPVVWKIGSKKRRRSR